MAMDKYQAMDELKQLIVSRENLIKTYQRKRSWRKSEIAIAVAHTKMQIEAIERAIQALRDWPER
jgi:aminoglycoside phosphotransferase (APT) family kinase protein